jgi:hypothetical protein
LVKSCIKHRLVDRPFKGFVIIMTQPDDRARP